MHEMTAAQEISNLQEMTGEYSTASRLPAVPAANATEVDRCPMPTRPNSLRSCIRRLCTTDMAEAVQTLLPQDGDVVYITWADEGEVLCK